MRIKSLLLLSALSVCGIVHSQSRYAAYEPGEHIAYEKPAKVMNVKNHVLDLNGKWSLQLSPRSKWVNITVPGEVVMQGYGVRHDEPVVYRREFHVPSDFRGNTAVLRFDGVYSYARLYVNNHFVREHRGGFTRWDTDISKYIKAGKKNEIRLEVIDPVEEISYASGYAHHPVLGILRDVSLMALPADNIVNLQVDAGLDSAFVNGMLRLNFDYTGKSDAAIAGKLLSTDGAKVFNFSKEVTPGENGFSFDIKNPQKWDAEHPRLYGLELSLVSGGDTLCVIRKKVGFRTIKVEGNRLLVNGRPVKLRGACRHDIHPALGRATDAETDLSDALLFKEANMNFVRTSHYPPNERFASICDSLGIYIECENAVCFVNTHRQKNYAPGATQNDRAFTEQYLGQTREMVSTFASHPSVLFWSIGNESTYGSNFQKSHDLVRSLDSTRPVIFSYPGSQNDSLPPVYDLLSMHYNDVYGNLWQWGKHTSHFEGEGKPAIFDEWAHPACYTYSTLQKDPGIREFWGKSLDMMWDGVYTHPGALGGAVWCYSDERFEIPDLKTGDAFWQEFAHTSKPEGFRGKCVGYGDWGIVDIWRRKKPEFWSTKKAYSPVRVEHDRELFANPSTPVTMTVRNRFDHTDLSEITAHYSYKDVSGTASLDNASPHSAAVMTVPALDWGKDSELCVWFSDKWGNDTIDSYVFAVNPTAESNAATGYIDGKILEVTESGRHFVIDGNGFEVRFNAATGLFGAYVSGNQVIAEGPWLNADINYNHLTGAEVRKISNNLVINPCDWKVDNAAIERVNESVILKAAGKYGEVSFSYTATVNSDATITIAYTTDSLPDGYLRETGLQFRLPASMEQLSYKRRGYWDSYPADAMSSNQAKLQIYGRNQASYRVRPENSWSLDSKDYYYWADKGAAVDNPLNFAAKSMKENIYFYKLTAQSGAGICVVSPDASVSCRLNNDSGNGTIMYVDNKWDYPEIAWGNYCKAASPLPCHGSVTIRLIDEGR